MQRIWRSFAVLLRLSLATLAQRLRQAQDDKLFGCGTEIFTASQDDKVGPYNFTFRTAVPISVDRSSRMVMATVKSPLSRRTFI
jgi:hypothetical protein